MNWKQFFCLFLLLVTLAACMSKDEEKEQEAKDDATKEEKTAEAKAATETYKPHLICPQVAIIHELELVKNYGADGAANAQPVAAARMKKIEGTCSYQDDGIDIAFTLNFVAGKSPRLAGDKIDFPYFIAVVDPDQTILNKNPMSVEFKFRSDEKTTEYEEPLHVFIPLPKDKNTTGPNYRVLAGFQLTEDQLKEVRKHENETVGLPATAAHN